MQRYSMDDLPFGAKIRNRGATDNTRVDGRSPGQHPRCADARRLAQTIGFAAEDCGVGPAIAWLPSRGSTPNPSSSMAGPVSRAKMRIKPWSVPSLRLGPEQAVELLQKCTNRSALTHGVAIGVDLAYWSRALLFAASLTVRQRFPAWCCRAERAHSSGLDANLCRR